MTEDLGEKQVKTKPVTKAPTSYLEALGRSKLKPV